MKIAFILILCMSMSAIAQTRVKENIKQKSGESSEVKKPNKGRR